MIISVFDNDVEALSHWRRFAAANGLQFLANNAFEPMKDGLEVDTQIIVLDQSVVYGDIVKAIATCCQQYRQHLIVATGEELSVQQSVQLIQNRAAWVFEKPLHPHDVQSAFSNIVEMARGVADRLAEYRQLQALFARLTSREQAVLDLILGGISNKDAAVELEISIRTVEARRARVYQKTNNENVVGLIQTVGRLQLLRQRFEPQLQPVTSILHHHLKINATLTPQQLDDDLNLAST